MTTLTGAEATWLALEELRRLRDTAERQAINASRAADQPGEALAKERLFAYCHAIGAVAACAGISESTLTAVGF